MIGVARARTPSHQRKFGPGDANLLAPRFWCPIDYWILGRGSSQTDYANRPESEFGQFWGIVYISQAFVVDPLKLRTALPSVTNPTFGAEIL